MKILRIITTIGTSIFENYKQTFLNEKYNIDDTLQNLLDKTAGELDFNSPDVIKLIGDEEDYGIQEAFFKGSVTKKDKKWVKVNDPNLLNIYASAEISSILKIYEEQIKQNENISLKVRLLASDTVLSVLSAILIKEWFEQGVVKQQYSNIEVIFNDNVKSPNADYIENLRTDLDEEDIYLGFNNLIEKVIDISKNKNEETIINITGGYKGFIPILTIIAQLEGLKLNYIYEDSEKLIEIGQFPVTFNTEIARAVIDILNEEDLSTIDKNSKIYTELKSFKLIYEKDNKIYPTKFSDIFIHYFKTIDKTQKDNLGYILEYILYYYFSVNKDKKYSKPILNDKINLFYNPETKEFKEQKKQPNGFIEVGDIDLELQNEKAEKIICEIKSLSGFLHYNEFYKKQIYPRIKYYKPKEFHIYLYKITFKNKDSSFENEKLKIKIESIKKKIEQDFDDITFLSRGFYIDMQKQNLGIDYTALLQKSFKEINWINL